MLTLIVLSAVVSAVLGGGQEVAVSQDTLGNYKLRYAIDGISRVEHGDGLGNVNGGFSYVDPHGILRKTEFTSGVHGYNAVGTDIPIPVQDTPEVAHAKANHLAALHAAYLVPRIPEFQGPEEGFLSPIGHFAAAPVAHFAPVARFEHFAPAPFVISALISTALAGFQEVAVSQDTLGNYNLKYALDGISRVEHGDAHGNVNGGFSYIDPHGIVRKTEFTSGVHGYNAIGTDIPVPVHDTPDVAHAKAKHLAALHAAYLVPRIPEFQGPDFFGHVGFEHFAPAPIHFAPAPFVISALISTALAGFQEVAVSQDTLGNYNLKYALDGISRVEHGDAHGNVNGGFSYIDPHGIVRKTEFTSGVHGYNAIGTDIPVPVHDTPDVAHAKAKHLAALHAAYLVPRIPEFQGPDFFGHVGFEHFAPAPIHFAPAPVHFAPIT
ncbi:hypothetical protein FQR65_LT11572 [Abscondita terminalis]|nr:hypothetical protein FQR65_LT11572 [Abscondita terminalis]